MLGLALKAVTFSALNRSDNTDLSALRYCWLRTILIASRIVLLPASFSPTRMFMCGSKEMSILLNFLKPSI